jgi:hypothetical protein
LRMSSEESYAKTYLFYKSASGILDPEMIEDTAKIVNEAMKDKVQVNLIINNRAVGNAPLIAKKIADRLQSEKQQGLLGASQLRCGVLQVTRVSIVSACFSPPFPVYSGY